ncbi:MAG: NAD(P)/FAD-dependent oxidoreductase [Nitratireductor sp.]
MTAIQNPDCLIIGAGVFGLWAARHAIKRGESVLVLDKDKVGSGASGGFLGSLMPHEPVRWNEKKQQQFEALSSLSNCVSNLQEDTGIDCGYRMCGRVIPLRHEKMEYHVAERVEGMKSLWAGKYTLKRIDVPAKNGAYKDTEFSFPQGWVNSDLAKFGATFDNFSARINPRAYLKALAAYVEQDAKIENNCQVVSINAADCSAQTASGESISAGRIIIANGYEAYELLAPIKPQYNGQLIEGRGVKGQAVLVEFEHDDTLPIIYDDGVYIVPHSHNRVAIGSTSVNKWNNASQFDKTDMIFYERAMIAVPALQNAPIVERWAGVRPRNTIPHPETGKVLSASICGALDGCDRVQVAIGGFKIGLGLAHLDNLAPKF